MVADAYAAMTHVLRFREEEEDIVRSKLV